MEARRYRAGKDVFSVFCTESISDRILRFIEAAAALHIYSAPL